MFAEVISNKYLTVFYEDICDKKTSPYWPNYAKSLNVLNLLVGFPNLASAYKCGSPRPIWGVKIEWDKMQIKMRGRYWTQQNGLFLNGSILRGRLQLRLNIRSNVLWRGRWVLGINLRAICKRQADRKPPQTSSSLSLYTSSGGWNKVQELSVMISTDLCYVI